MNFGQVMLVRGVFAIVLIAALAWYQGALRPLRTLMLKPVALRVAAKSAAPMTFLAAIVHLPLANTSAIFQALPLAVTLGAALIFGEPVGWRRWLGDHAGFVGVLIIVRPGVAGFNQFSLFALVSVVFCAVRDLATRQIPTHIPSLFITLADYHRRDGGRGVILVPLGGWTPPSPHALGLLALAAVLVLIGYQYVIMCAALRRHLGGSAVPLHRAAVGDVARLSRLRRRARRPDGDWAPRSSCCPASMPSTANACVSGRWRRTPRALPPDRAVNGG